MQDNLDTQIRELSAKIDRLWQSVHEGQEKLWELIRARKEMLERERRSKLSLESFPYPQPPLWIDPSPQRPLSNPSCAGMSDRELSMA
jgi:hypothetical protein